MSSLDADLTGRIHPHRAEARETPPILTLMFFGAPAAPAWAGFFKVSERVLHTTRRKVSKSVKSIFRGLKINISYEEASHSLTCLSAQVKTEVGTKELSDKAAALKAAFAEGQSSQEALGAERRRPLRP